MALIVSHSRDIFKMADKQKDTRKKARYWWAVFYPNDSAPEDWKEQLQKTGIPAEVIVHDKDQDTDPETGLPVDKKLHAHIIWAYSGPNTPAAADAIAVDLLKGKPAQPLSSIKGAHRYLTHKDNPEKHQYSENDIETVNGFDIGDFVASTKGEVNALYKAIEHHIKEQGIEDLADLMDYLNDEGLEDYALFVRFNTYYIDKLLKSIYHRKRKAKKDELLDLQLEAARFAANQRAMLAPCDINFDPITGEVVD